MIDFESQHWLWFQSFEPHSMIDVHMSMWSVYVTATFCSPSVSLNGIFVDVFIRHSSSRWNQLCNLHSAFICIAACAVLSMLAYEYAYEARDMK